MMIEHHESRSRATLTGIILVVVGMQVFIVQPGFLAGLTSHFALTDTWAGYVAGAEMAGIAMTTITAAVLGPRLAWRPAVLGGLLLLAAANLTSIFVEPQLPFMLCRAAAGLGAGLIISIGYGMLARATNPDRAFGHAIMATLSYGAAGIFLLPSAFSVVDAGGILAVLALMALAAVPFAQHVPANGLQTRQAMDARTSDKVRRQRSVLILTAILAFFLGQGVVWPFLALIGKSFGITDQAVANGLAISQVTGIAGAFVAARFGTRTNHAGLLWIGILGTAIPLAIMGWRLDATSYAIAAIIFNTAANVATPLLMAIAATIEADGPLVQRAAALQMIGLAAGPILVTPFIETSYGPAIGLAVAFLLVALISGIGALPRYQHSEAV